MPPDTLDSNKNEPLRTDIRLLGRALGDTVREQEGEEVFEIVERVRQTAVRFARENAVPYLGICLGMQVAVIEFARHVAGLAGAHSTEFDPHTPHPVIALIAERRSRRSA